MGLSIPEEFVLATRLTEHEFLLEIAILFFQKEKLTLGQAALLADLPVFQFQAVLAGRGIPMHYGVEDYEEDIKTLAALSL